MKHNQRAFTLIELLVVVLIIGILAAVAVPQYQKAVDKSRMTQAFVWAKSLAEAERVYHLANGEYTSNLEELDVSFPNCTQREDNDKIWKCADAWQIDLSHYAGVTGSGYVYLPAKWTPTNSSARIEYYFSSNLRLCFANSERFQKVCRSLGATPYESHENFFRLP